MDHDSRFNADMNRFISYATNAALLATLRANALTTWMILSSCYLDKDVVFSPYTMSNLVLMPWNLNLPIISVVFIIDEDVGPPISVLVISTTTTSLPHNKTLTYPTTLIPPQTNMQQVLTPHITTPLQIDVVTLSSQPTNLPLLLGVRTDDQPTSTS